MKPRLTLAFLLWVATLYSTCAQAPSPTLQAHSPADQRLAFDIIVRAAGSGKAPELPSASSLRARIDGKQVTSASISVARQPPQLMFVLDAVNTPRADLVRCQEALLTWLRSAGESLPYDTTILIVSDTEPSFKRPASDSASTWALIQNELYVSRLSPSRNPAELAAKLTAYHPGLARLGQASNAVSGNERVHISLQALSFLAAAIKDSPVPKLILWLSPGWPFVHMTDSGYKEQLFDSAVYFDDELRSARVVLYALDPTGAATDRPAPTGDEMLALRPGANQSGGPMRQPSSTPGSDYYRNFLEPVRSAANADPNNMILQVLAIHSGGTVQTSSNDLLGGITRFAADADAVFSVSFPALKVTGKTTFHRMDIASSTAGETLRTRAGFYAH